MHKFKNSFTLSSLILGVLSLVATLFVFSHLPEQIPTHWNTAGQIDSYGSRYFALFTAILPILLLGLFLVLPKIDPKKDAYSKHAKAYYVCMLLITLFMIVIHWATVFVALGFNLSISMIVPAGVGILFIILGNYMPQIRPNYTFGIKVPWALNNPDNWRATHRFGGYCFILGGILMLLEAFINSELMSTLMSVGLMICIFAPMIYSYIYYTKHEGKK
ncbi:MAG: SdpI family protein [Cellulosilyticaceae bacterium]